ncbi:MAG: hypothetical protein HOD92_20350 [Deltaproteobacteria bacterium]|nr:hypothetical protein [Deltaproteobacteria bacterium]
MIGTFKESEPTDSLDQNDKTIKKNRKKKRCTYNMIWYDHGDQICFDGEVQECDDGDWLLLGVKCK